MPQKPLSRESAAEMMAALAECEGNTLAAARMLGIAPGTAQNRIRTAETVYGMARPQKPAPAPRPPPVEADPREIRDATFWRRRFVAEERARLDAELAAEQLAGVRSIPVTIPEWVASEREGRIGKSVIGCLISDIHMGEVISAGEINGINEFNPDIARERLSRYFDAACEVGSRWASDTDCEGVLLALAGDLISGDLHTELTITNALTAHEQVSAAVGCIVAGIGRLVEQFGRVHVIGVPGNHGRTTMKPTAKLYARLSYDMLVVSMVAERFSGDDRVTFQADANTDQITPIFGRLVLTTHGDKIGTKGGSGFAGPNLPIVRGAKKIAEQQAAVDRLPHLIQFGHYHTSTNPGAILGNGSVPGYSEYGHNIRAVVEPPQQWLYLLHSKWWMRERAPIQLEAPRTPALPKVRVPARMSAA